MKLIFFDFEVFKHDTLLGTLLVDGDNVELFQTWDVNEIKKFYEKNKNRIWLGWNNSHYDNHILEACVRGLNAKKVNDDIIEKGLKKYLNIPLVHYDIMNSVGFFSLKNSEALAGKKISESEVSFNLDRKLTEEEKRLTEEYNFDDLEQTLENFIAKQDAFILRLETIREYNLPMSALSITGSRVAEQVLHAKRIDGISEWVVKPPHYKNLKVKNEKLLDFYLNEKFLTGKKFVFDLCGVEHTIGVGGIHGARKKYQAKKALYFDVSGYYNLIMIKYGLLPRSIPDEYKKVYEDMYYEQLKLKKINPKKRAVLKEILLCVFGASLNQYLGFFDPYHGRLITMTGQMFLVDLLEKMEGKIELVQSNTDGIIVIPLEGTSEQEIIDIIDEWQERTGFTLKVEHIEDIVQRDVNCYMYKKDGKITTVGGDMKDWKEINIFSSQKEPRIIGRTIVEYFMNNKTPEEVIEEFKDEVEMFQFIAKKQSFDYVELETTSMSTKSIDTERVQHVNRAFASNDEEYIRALYKCKPEGKVKRTKMPNFPENIFIYNNEILSDYAKETISKKIDYSFYVERAYSKIKEFIDIPKIKGLSI